MEEAYSTNYSATEKLLQGKQNSLLTSNIKSTSGWPDCSIACHITKIFSPWFCSPSRKRASSPFFVLL
jgi:hypothetical protein